MEVFAHAAGLYAALNQTVLLKGVNWFGFETATFSPHGLWATSADYLLDFVRQNKFNTIRVPFSTEFAEGMDTIRPNAISYGMNPDLVGKTGGQVMDIIIKKCKQRNILVLLDMHRFKGDGFITDLWYGNGWPESRVIAAWQKIVARYKNEPTVFAVDLKNEPHGVATWGGDPKTDWASAAERMGKAIHKVNPKLLVFVEGVEKTDDPNRPGWWGGSMQGVAKRPIKLDVPNKVVYSPHVYGPSVFMRDYFAKSAGFPGNMRAIWERDFGYLMTRKIAPVVIGEWGGTNEPGSLDRAWQDAIAKYFVDTKKLCNSYWWSLNPNSADTKGLLDDDWVHPVQHRLDRAAQTCPNPTNLDRFLGPPKITRATTMQAFTAIPQALVDLVKTLVYKHQYAM